MKRGDQRLFALVGWNLIAIGGVGALIMPIPGFWILIAIAPLVFHVARGRAGRAVHTAQRSA
jgi:hypothetical protein